MTNKLNHQQGVVLVVAILMMAVIAISTAVIMKSLVGQDKIAGNQRSRTMALEDAEMALRYCEARVTTTTLTASQQSMVVLDQISKTATPPEQVFSNWADDRFRNILPTAFVTKGARAAECMIRRLSLRDVTSDGSGAPSGEAYVITARGFSPNYAEAAGVPTSGAVIWLQSTVQFRY